MTMLNITIDLQDIFDVQNETAYNDGYSENQNSSGGYDLNKAIKAEIIDKLLSRISAKCIDEVMKVSKEKIDKALDLAITESKNAIEQKSIEYANNWLLGENIKLTDQFGNVTEETSIKKIIEDGFTNTLEKRVDDSGSFIKGGSFSNGTKLIQYISDKHIKTEVEKRLPSLSHKLDKQIRESIDEHATSMIAAKISSVISQSDSK